MRLAGCKVERWLVLPESMALEDFHDAIQVAFGWEHTQMYRDDQWTPESAEAFLKGPSAEEVTKRMREQIGNSVDLSRIRL